MSAPPPTLPSASRGACDDPGLGGYRPIVDAVSGNA
ncbi:hypothetical protein GGP89_001037 [Salinibacter ruber]|uniref:Uncharacterized protein n=1 Tax=Salinibacter ruber TaxID=146919 RepID=A0A9X2REK3_9BACT|nr:hypothetical protein [Salinibacter ruber]MCS3864488.1 hypothetical protein [Salinibacter ruber]